jgi:hypothetical protein
MKHPIRALAAALGLAVAASAQADIIVSEVAPWSSGNSAVGADWFELSNTGSSAVDISGWKMDDNSNSFGAAVALTGIASIAAGGSVIFIEGGSAGFVPDWFGANAPAGLQIGSYAGSGVGLSTGGDAVNIFDATGGLMTRVGFGASPSSAPYASFDNAAGLSGSVSLTALSAVGVNGAFLAASGSEIGSPGSIAAVPEPGGFALLAAGLGVIGMVVHRRRV